jgi:hypothetical protein
MESNPLLINLKDGNIQELVRYLEITPAVNVRAAILDLLKRQREKCSENVFVKTDAEFTEFELSCDVNYWVDKESILDAKLI